MQVKKKLSYKKEINTAWRNAWKHKAFRVQSIITLIVVLSFSVIFNRFFDFVESRSGATMNDFLLPLLPGYNVAWIVFFFLYSGIFIGLYYHLNHPKTILVIAR